uniref:Uncharacterized protein n=1 Tax=Oryza punctata TaxID=4537 RepID=A0A0E0LBQ6_ORYPU
MHTRRRNIRGGEEEEGRGKTTSNVEVDVVRRDDGGVASSGELRAGPGLGGRRSVDVPVEDWRQQIKDAREENDEEQEEAEAASMPAAEAALPLFARQGSQSGGVVLKLDGEALDPVAELLILHASLEFMIANIIEDTA